MNVIPEQYIKGMSLLSVLNDIHQQQVIFNKRMYMNFDKTSVQGELREQEPMSRHTSWKTGGNADYYYRAVSIEDLSEFMAMLPDDMPVTWVGLGSNLLVRDGGIPGVVISVAGMLDSFELISDTEIKLGAGLPSAKAARFAARRGLTGIEFLAGIPGTVGGALAMNAGAYGNEIWRHVYQVETVNRQGVRRILTKDQFEIGYRSVSIANDEWFISANLKLELADKEIVEKRIRTLLAERADTQPLGKLSCGSVFRNPPNDHAARLIDECGLKGKKIGGACVSEKHANFIINSGNASSTDIEQLIEFVQAEVYKQKAVKLIPEVRIIGKAADVVTSNNSGNNY